VKLYDKSKSLAENKDALAAINKAIELSPDHWLVYLKRSLLFKDVAKDYEKSIKDLNSAIHTITPEQKQNNILAILYDARAQLYLLQNKLLPAMNDFMSALKVEPDISEVYFGFFVLFSGVKADDLNNIVKKYPKDYRSYVIRARFNSNPASDSKNINAYDDAITDLKKALKLNNKDFIIYYLLSEAHKRKALKSEENNPKILDISNRKRVIDDATMGLKLIASNAWKKYFFELRAEEYLITKEYRKAINDYNSIFQLYPNLAKPLIDRALVFIETKQFDEAVRDLTKVIEQKNNSKDDYLGAYDVRASVYEAMGKYKEAINDYTNWLSLEDEAEYGLPCAYVFGSCLFLRRCAEAHRKIGEYGLAILDYDKAISRAVESSKILFYSDMGDTYVEMKNQEKAIIEYTKAIMGSESPDNSYLYYNRAIAYFRLGKDELGVQDLRISAKLGNEDAKETLKANNLEE
jgi:tetratricopeptide (TPR) repeat protein